MSASLVATVRAVVALGLLGFVVSWGWFVAWGMDHGLDFFGFWAHALTSGEAATGLVWDLVACGLSLTVIAVYKRRELGTGGTAAVVIGTWCLGVCVGMALLAALMFKAQQRAVRLEKR